MRAHGLIVKVITCLQSTDLDEVSYTRALSAEQHALVGICTVHRLVSLFCL